METHISDDLNDLNQYAANNEYVLNKPESSGCVSKALWFCQAGCVWAGPQEESMDAVLTRCLVPHQHSATSVTPWDSGD